MPAVYTAISLTAFAGCVALLFYVRSIRRQVERNARRMREDAELARLARTSQLITPGSGIQVAFALYAAAACSPFELGHDARIRYWGPQIPGNPDKPLNRPLA